MRALGAALAMTALLVASPSFAQDRATAEAMFDEGLRLSDQGKFAEACPKFAASFRSDPASGTLLNLGRCYEKIGKTASAWSSYRELQSIAHKENNPKREAAAKVSEEKLRPKLAKLTLTFVGAPPAGLVLKRDGSEVDRAELASPVPIDPGDHVIDATAPGKKPWSRSVHVADAENASLAIPALEDTPAAPVALSTRLIPERGELTPPQIGALGAAGLGVIGLGVGTVFGIIALGHASDARDHCVGAMPCDETGLAARGDARSSADIATIGLVVGGILLATGAVLWLTVAAPHRSARRTSLVVAF